MTGGLAVLSVLALGMASCGRAPAAEIDGALARVPPAQVAGPQAGAPPGLPLAADTLSDVVGGPAADLSGVPSTASTEPAGLAPGVAVPVHTPGDPSGPIVPAAPAPSPPPPAVPAGIDVYAGLGTWIDAYDWSRTFGKDGPLVEVADIDRMADLGVQTLYVQTSRWNAPADILEPERLVPLIERAQNRGMAVVAWYLPTFVDPAADLRRLQAAATLDVDAVAVDIESRDVVDTAERNRRLVDLSRALRAALPGMALGAIVFPPVAMEVINPAFWPGFPWGELGPLYDVWIPMAYQSFRTDASGYRDGYRYTAENIDRIRGHLGGGVVIHTVGGIADVTTPGDVEGMVRAADERGAIGGSLYDWRTTGPELWGPLQGFVSRG